MAIIDNKEHLVGVVTDGDARRALINKEKDVEKIVNYSPIVMPFNTPREVILHELRKRRRRHMPLVGSDGQLLDLFTLDDFEFREYSDKVVIMAGGLGTRLGDLTRDLPKPMLPIGDKPLLEHIVAKFESHGFRNFIFTLNYKADIIRAYFGDGKKWGVNIDYIQEDTLLGTAGALSLLRPEEITDNIFVANGDLLFDLDLADFLDFHKRKSAAITIGAKQLEASIPYAVLTISGESHLSSFVEKPNFSHWVNLGIYALSKSALRYIPKNTHFNMTDLLSAALREQEAIRVYKTSGSWIDIGQVTDYERARRDY